MMTNPLSVFWSGGGSRITAHLGSAKAIQESSHEPVLVGGTSAGLYTAIAFAMGLVDELTNFMYNNNEWVVNPFIKKGSLKLWAYWNLCFGNSITQQKDEELIDAFILEKEWEEWRTSDKAIPIYALTVARKSFYVKLIDITNCEWKLARAIILASGRIPVFTPPVWIDGMPFVDGGIIAHSIGGEFLQNMDVQLSKQLSINAKPFEHFTEGNKSYHALQDTMTLYALNTYRNNLYKEQEEAKKKGIHLLQVEVEEDMLTQYDTNTIRQMSSYFKAHRQFSKLLQNF